MDNEQVGYVVSEGVFTDWYPVPFDFIDLYDLLLKEVCDPVLSKESEKSLSSV